MPKILLIEDNPDIRSTVSDVLIFNQFDVIEASDGLSAIDLAITTLPDLVLCDVLMPKLNGWQTLEKFRKIPELKHTLFVFTTALTRMDDMRKGMSLGADDYITKPFDNKGLVNTIRRLLIKRALLKTEILKIHQSESVNQEIGIHNKV